MTETSSPPCTKQNEWYDTELKPFLSLGSISWTEDKSLRGWWRLWLVYSMLQSKTCEAHFFFLFFVLKQSLVFWIVCCRRDCCVWANTDNEWVNHSIPQYFPLFSACCFPEQSIQLRNHNVYTQLHHPSTIHPSKLNQLNKNVCENFLIHQAPRCSHFAFLFAHLMFHCDSVAPLFSHFASLCSCFVSLCSYLVSLCSDFASFCGCSMCICGCVAFYCGCFVSEVV